MFNVRMMYMVTVKLKMRGIYKAFLSCVGFLIILIMLIGFLYFFYDRITTPESDIEVAGNLSINYIDGKSLCYEKKDNVLFEFDEGVKKIERYVENVENNNMYVSK